jgi:hypothetical protein
MMKKSFSLMDAGAERRVTCRADRPIPGRAQPHTTLNITPHLYLISLANDYLDEESSVTRHREKTLPSSVIHSDL